MDEDIDDADEDEDYILGQSVDDPSLLSTSLRMFIYFYSFIFTNTTYILEQQYLVGGAIQGVGQGPEASLQQLIEAQQSRASAKRMLELCNLSKNA